MSNQGILGALRQYWNVEEKARLHRRNTYFEDVTLSNYDAIKVCVVFTVLVITIISIWLIGSSL